VGRLAVEKLQRLRRELEETENLLKSPRVNGGTRYVLERLRTDLEQQIASLERGGQSEAAS